MKIFPVFIPHAGCPHHCLFCAQDKTNSQTEAPSPEEAREWLRQVLPQQGEGEIAFYGGTFTALPADRQLAYLKIAYDAVLDGRAASVRISTRPDAIDKESLERLYSYGVRTVELGCQSFSDEVLNSAGRGHNSAENVAAIQLSKEFGFSVGVQLMPGLPGDTPDSAMQSLLAALETQPDFLRIYPAVVIAGTGLAELWHAGLFTPWTLDDAVEACAEMLLYCQRRHIPVIRMGLQEDPQLTKHLLAGPYHPAFGQLVRSRLWRNTLLQASRKGQNFTVNPADYSDAVGHRGENRDQLMQVVQEFSLHTDTSVPRGAIRVAGQELSLYDISLQRIERR